MPFEPKIIRPSEPPELAGVDGLTDDQFEARLPGELEFLAAQLRDDAAHLASIYPARSEIDELPTFVETPARSSRHRIVFACSAAGTLASVVLAVVISLPWLIPSERVHTPNLADSKISGLTKNAAPENRDTDLGRLVQAVVDKSDLREFSNSSVTPAVFLQNVSGPELEGLFDLWEEDPAEQSRISI